MPLNHAIGSFLIPAGSTTAISPTLTWRGGGGSATPQALIFFTVNAAAGTGTGHQFTFLGMTDGTRHFCQANYASDAVNATVARGYVSNTAPGIELDSTGAKTGQLDFTSFGTDTFTVTPSDAFVNAHTVYYIAFAGYTNVRVQNDVTNTTNANFSITGLGFQPERAFFMGGQTPDLDLADGIGRNCFSFATAVNQVLLGFSHRGNASTTDYTWGIVKSGSILNRMVTSAESDNIALVSFDSDGATFSHSSASSNAQRFAGLYLKGGAATIALTTSRTSVGTFGVTVAGVNPSLVIGIANNTATASQSAPIEEGNITIGALTSGEQWSVVRYSSNRETLGGATVTEEYNISSATKFVLNHNRTGVDTLSAVGEVEKSSLASELVTLNQSDADTALTYLAIIALGETVAPPKKIGKNQSFKLNMGEQKTKINYGFRSGLSTIIPTSSTPAAPGGPALPINEILQKIGYWLRRRFR